MLSRVPTSLPDDVERLVARIIEGCLDVHSALGPGLSELVYLRALCVEFEVCDIPFEREKALPVRYRDRTLCHHRVDVLVANAVVVEVKSVDRIHPVHLAQAVSYLRLTGARVGLIVNFNTLRLRDGGIRRVVV